MVSDSKDINPRTIRAHNLGTGSVTTAKVGKKIIHTEAADPTVASDAGTGYEVGSLWNNTSSGEIFICASSSEEDANWKGQDGNNINDPFKLQGSTYGFYMGGDGPVRSDKITRFTFASPQDASDVAEMAFHRTQIYDGSLRNETHAFITGGYTYGGYGPNPGGRYDTIERFSLTTPFTGADVGEMTEAKDMGINLTDGVTGLLVGGGTPGIIDKIEQFTLGGSPITATDTSSELARAHKNMGGVSDAPAAKGYMVGGDGPSSPAAESTIESIPIGIAPGGSTSDHGELTMNWAAQGGGCSPTHGYSVGGYSPPASPSNVTNIEKFSFTAPANGTDVGELTANKADPAVCQSTTALYSCLGIIGGTVQDVIEEIPYATDSNGTDVGEAVDALRHGSATEV